MSPELVQAQPGGPLRRPKLLRTALRVRTAILLVLTITFRTLVRWAKLLVLRLVVETHPWGLACASGEQAVSFLEKTAACATLR